MILIKSLNNYLRTLSWYKADCFKSNLFTITISLLFSFQSFSQATIGGCTDSLALNFDAGASYDNGSLTGVLNFDTYQSEQLKNIT